MRKISIESFLFLSLIIFFFSCEYDNNKMNFHELAPPEKEVQVLLNLANLPNGEPIYIYGPTQIRYSLGTSSGEITYKKFYLGDSRVYGDEESIYLDPTCFEENTLTSLKVEIQLTSGTGSLAEMLGGEKTDKIELSYPVKFVRPNYTIEINQGLSKNGFLEIYWNKPIFEGAKVEKYEVYSNIDGKEVLVKTITNPNQSSFEDINYVYGEKHYRITASVNAGSAIYKSEAYYNVKYMEIKQEDTSFKLVEGGKLQLTINNPNPYKSKYYIINKGQIIENNDGSNAILIENRPPYPIKSHLSGVVGYKNYMIYIAPVSAKTTELEQKFRSHYFITAYQEIQLEQQYESHSDRRIFKSSSFSLTDNTLLLFNQEFGGNSEKYHLTAYNLTENRINHDIKIPHIDDRSGFEFQNFLFKEVGSSNILIASEYEGYDPSIKNIVYIYSSFKLNNLIKKIDLDQREKVISFTTDNLLLTRKGEEYYLYRVTTGEKLKTWTFPATNIYKLSPNGEYLSCIENKTTYSFYNFDSDFNINPVYTDVSSEIREIVFHSIKDEIAYITSVNNSTYALNSYLINLKKGNVIRQFDKGIQSIDPVTDNICLSDDMSNYPNWNIHILNKEYLNLYTLESSEAVFHELKLYNGYLVADYNSILDISNVIK